MSMNVRVQNSIVHANSVALDRCPIPIVAYGGETDNVVRADIAQGYFTNSGVIPGDHFSIIQPTDQSSAAFTTTRENLLKALQEPMPRVSDWRAKAERALQSSLDDIYVVPQVFRFESVVMAPEVPSVNITVHAGAIDLVRNCDILVSSENVYFEMAKPFKPSTSGRLRSASAKKNEAGEIIDDVMFNEMNEWLRKNGKHGLQVPVGTVAPTTSGELVKQGIKRVYHAAIVTPVVGTSEYSVDREGVARAVRNVFTLARNERAGGMDLKSICLPLFGAGRGRMDPEESFTLIWDALKTELVTDPTWNIVFATWRKSETAMVRERIRSLTTGRAT